MAESRAAFVGCGGKEVVMALCSIFVAAPSKERVQVVSSLFLLSCFPCQTMGYLVLELALG